MTLATTKPTTSNPPPIGAQTSALPQVRVELRSNPLFLSGVREMVGAVAKRFGFSDEVGGQVALAVDEALCNVIRHGYQRQPDKPIWLSIFAVGGAWAAGTPVPSGGTVDERPDAMRIVIEDEAPQVDPSQICSRDLDEIRPGGLGVHIIKTVMDEAVYEKRPSKGMRLTMIKRRIGSNAAALGAAGAKGCGCATRASGGSGAAGTEACHG